MGTLLLIVGSESVSMLIFFRWMPFPLNAVAVALIGRPAQLVDGGTEAMTNTPNQFVRRVIRTV